MNAPARRSRISDWLLLTLIGTALILGGGAGGAPPVFTGIVELIGLTFLAALAIGSAPPMAASARPAALFVAVVAITMAAQLAPLPPSIWGALPGRDVSNAVRAMLGLQMRWFPFTLDPERTLAAALSLIPAVATFIGVSLARASVVRRALGIVVVVAVLDLGIAALQLASHGEVNLSPWDASTGWGIGLFDNHNHAADFLLIAPLLAVVLFRDMPRLKIDPRLLAFALAIPFTLGAVLTFSRAGVLLAPISLIGLAVLARRHGRPRGSTISRIGPIVAATGLAAVIALWLWTGDTMVAGVAERFRAFNDGETRLDFWPDVLYAIRQLWPFGGGSGTFDVIFRSVERLDTVGPAYINHAHNDYLEVAMELGLWGCLLITAGLGLIAWRIGRTLVWRRGARAARIHVAAAFGMAVPIVHSLVDYPLRTHAISVLFALLAGLLFAPPPQITTRAVDRPRVDRPRTGRRVVIT